VRRDHVIASTERKDLFVERFDVHSVKSSELDMLEKLSA
jgi:hypothetical protein